jgi:hypothetical protein
VYRSDDLVDSGERRPGAVARHHPEGNDEAQGRAKQDCERGPAGHPGHQVLRLVRPLVLYYVHHRISEKD